MKKEFIDRFTALWQKYFDGAELPIAFFYTDLPEVKPAEKSAGHMCIFADIKKARDGKTLVFDTDTIGCHGGRRYMGFSKELMPGFEYFLSCGLEGKIEGERYKKSPELVKEFLNSSKTFDAPAKFIVFKRWDKLLPEERPEAVIFFAKTVTLSGLFTLANFDEAEANAVFTPFAAGCGTLVQYPYLENMSGRPRCVLGLFDVSARPYFADELSFAVPMKKFERMVGNMKESFLITDSWKKARARMEF